LAPPLNSNKVSDIIKHNLLNYGTLLIRGLSGGSTSQNISCRSKSKVFSNIPGFTNLGNTCFISVVIKFLLNLGTFHSKLKSLSSDCVFNSSLKSLVKAYLSGKSDFVNFCHNLSNDEFLCKFVDGTQNCSFAFFNSIVNYISENSEILDDIFAIGYSKSLLGPGQKILDTKHFVSPCLSIDIPDGCVTRSRRNLSYLLKQFNETHTCIENNITVKRKATLTNLPKVLVIQLNRVISAGTKNDTSIKIPKNIIISKIKYKLSSVILHSGDAISGHYRLLYYDDNFKLWFISNDAYTYKVTNKELTKYLNSSSEPCGLVYENIESYIKVPEFDFISKMYLLKVPVLSKVM